MKEVGEVTFEAGGIGTGLRGGLIKKDVLNISRDLKPVDDERGAQYLKCFGLVRVEIWSVQISIYIGCAAISSE